MPYVNSCTWLRAVKLVPVLCCPDRTSLGWVHMCLWDPVRHLLISEHASWLAGQHVLTLIVPFMKWVGPLNCGPSTNIPQDYLGTDPVVYVQLML